MKPKRLIIKNIGILEDVDLPINKPLILLLGELCQGKTSILNAIKMCFGGAYPSDLIRHGEQEASVVLEFDNGSITREWYRSKRGEVTDRPIVFIQDGKTVKDPVKNIKIFLNPFLLDNEHFLKMNERERTKYLADLFAVDTSELDVEMKSLELDAKDLRATIKAYGEIEVAEVVLLDVEATRKELDKIRSSHNIAVANRAAEIDKIRDEHQQKVNVINHENTQAEILDADRARAEKEISDAEAEIARLTGVIKDKQFFLKLNPSRERLPLLPVPEFPPPIEPPDTSELEAKISQGEANKVLYEQYQKDLKRLAEKSADKKRLSDMEARQGEIRKAKIAKLAEVDTGGIAGLTFDEDGNFLYEGTQAAMLSTSQIMRLSSQLSDLYPKGFGLELIDRAESLGKSIFTFIERATREEKSILATIVGEQPAQVPEHVGVFIVEHGEVKKSGYVWCSKNGGRRVPASKCLKCDEFEKCNDRKAV